MNFPIDYENKIIFVDVGNTTRVSNTNDAYEVCFV